MSKEFNTTGICVSELHYMVDISQKIDRIMELIEKGKYFTINKPRQYGKTTTLFKLYKQINKNEKYCALKLSFEGIGDESYNSERTFINVLLKQFRRNFKLDNNEKMVQFIDANKELDTLNEFDEFITELIEENNKRVILLIDEVDKNSNNELFLNFLGMLRNKYIMAKTGEDVTFHSVILAGVHDVKTLKFKIRSDDDRMYNSPWNIAVDFKIDMSFSPKEISTMLVDYSKELEIGMDFDLISQEIYYYTEGYPFLVSSICKIIDEKILKSRDIKKWEVKDIESAVKIILNERNTNFESLIKNLENNTELYKIVYEIIIDGQYKTFNIDNPIIDMGVTYGIFNNKDGRVSISNRIYEQRIYNYMASKIETSTDISNYNFRKNFINEDGSLNFEKILLKFQEFMKKEYSSRDIKFLERNGRLLFLAFIKPIINGKGFDFKEVQISEEKRLDVVVSYNDKVYLSELKIWRGEEAHKSGIKQLVDYLENMSLDMGYLLIYDFTKIGEKEFKQDRINVSGKDIFIVWV